MNQIYNYFKSGEASLTKHELLVEGIIEAIATRQLRQGQPLPSVNDFMRELSLSRMTILKALYELKDRGIVESKNRVGYFVRNEDVDQQLKVMLVLTAFSSYHEAMYNSLMDELKGTHIVVDLFFHHGNTRVLKSILNEHKGQYGLCVVTPIPDPEVIGILDTIPEHKLLQIVRPVCSKKEISYISQDFFEEVINALDTIKKEICRYDEFVMVFPEGSFHSPDIVKAFSSFCGKHGIRHSVREQIDEAELQKGQAYFVIEDSHLIGLIKTAENLGFRLGKEIGILSYNDTPMKEIIRQGITVISTDFQLMGRKTADFALNRRPVQEVIETKIILRKSI
ncbi:MAG: GntR family transcriptional regulator [Bacteroidetes bacterium]|nr:GntR family transcriptional regulator [Bacteroidota bacterium]